MKTNRFASIVLSFVLLVSIVSCGGSQTQSTNPVVQTSPVSQEATPYLQVTSDVSSGREGTQYWKGTFPDSFYLLNSNGVPAIEISGISWMILTYDKISGDITSFDFGMSEVTYKILRDYSSDFQYLANDDASTYPKELGLTGPVWIEMHSDTLNGLNVGVQQFSFVMDDGNGVVCEIWTFNYTSDQMTGGIENPNPAKFENTCNFWNRQSEPNAFHLYKQ